MAASAKLEFVNLPRGDVATRGLSYINKSFTRKGREFPELTLPRHKTADRACLFCRPNRQVSRGSSVKRLCAGTAPTPCCATTDDPRRDRHLIHVNAAARLHGHPAAMTDDTPRPASGAGASSVGVVGCQICVLELGDSLRRRAGRCIWSNWSCLRALTSSSMPSWSRCCARRDQTLKSSSIHITRFWQKARRRR